MDADEVLMTPPNLTKILVNFPEDTKKYVVLQGCYSGTFIQEQDVGIRKTLLTGVPNITAITAARWDRTSFGCGPGDKQTYFGETFNSVLEGHRSSPDKIDWRSLYTQLEKKIDDKEFGLSVPVSMRSLPQFFASSENSLTSAP